MVVAIGILSVLRAPWHGFQANKRLLGSQGCLTHLWDVWRVVRDSITHGGMVPFPPTNMEAEQELLIEEKGLSGAMHIPYLRTLFGGESHLVK